MTKKKSTSKKRKSLKKKGGSGSALKIFFSLVVIAAVYFFLFGPNKTIPLFESYHTVGISGFKDLDRRVYDALMDLDVSAQRVHFNRVETRHSRGMEWTFSDLEVRLSQSYDSKKIEKTFLKNLASIDPPPKVRWSQKEKNKRILLVSFQGHTTHSITMVPAMIKKVAAKKPDKKPKVAIIIDDMGYDYGMAKQFVRLDENLSISVLPHSPFQKKIARLAHLKGRDVLLHLPMEPMEYPEVDPGKGALLESMSPDELLAQLRKNLKAVPYVLGVNNHMGSRLTQNASKMRQIFTILKKRNLFFVDSFTSPESRCAQVAQRLHVKFARRQVFLDHVQQPNAVRIQIKRLISIAKSKGRAIGIGHPYPVTLKVLSEELEEIQKEVSLVPVSTLVG